MSITSPQATSIPLYAGFWRRAAAHFVDGIILLVPVAVTGIVLGEASAPEFLINVAISCAYFAGFHSSAKQATPGKMAFGIKVSTLTGERIGIGRGIGRYFASWLSYLTLLIGYLMAAFTQKKQALHDMISGTLVVSATADTSEIVTGGGVMPVTTGVRVVVALFLIVPSFGGFLAAIAIPAYRDYVPEVAGGGRIVIAPAMDATCESRLPKR